MKWMLKELLGTDCRCGADKQKGQTFCYLCYMKLPAKKRKALSRRFGQGYEEAYMAAFHQLFPGRHPNPMEDR